MSDTVRCPRPECNHPINDHRDRCIVKDCNCLVDPNTIALAAVSTALFGGLTQPPKIPGVRRQPDGSWS